MEETAIAPSHETIEQKEVPTEHVEDERVETTAESEENAAAQATLDALDELPDIMDQANHSELDYLPEQLEIAREQMHEVYPLPENMWIAWINDALKEADTEEGEQKLRLLYDKADSDYLSVNVWKSYTDFILKKFHAQFGDDDEGMKDEAESESLVESTREDLLKAVRATTYHIAESHQIWNAYIGFENEVLEDVRFTDIPLFSPEQLAHVKRCYLDRLAHLHLACEDTFSGYSQFISKWDNSNYETNMVESNKIYAETKVAADERDLYEQKLASATRNTDKESGYSLDVFYEYIEYEKTASNKSSLNNVRNLYERAILLYCTDVSLWDDYILFLLECARIPAFLESITLRAVRNCPWSGVLWAHLARRLESGQRDREQILDIFDRALSNKTLLSSLEDLVTVLTAKCDFERRRIDWEEPDENDVMDLRVAFEEAMVYISEAFPETGDPFYRIEKYYAFIEASINPGKKLDNEEKARELWEGIVKKHGQDTEAWLQYIDFERYLGNTHRCVSLFKRALPKKLDYPERFMNAWITMEHEIGSIESTEEAFIRVAKKTKSLMRQWQVDAIDQELSNEQKRNKEIQQKVKKAAHRKNQRLAKKERPSEEVSKPQKRKISEDQVEETFKKPRLQEDKKDTDNQGFRVPAPKKPAGPANRKRSTRLAIPKLQKKPAETDSSSGGETDQAPASNEPKSNEDFRAMLLGRK
ncbi:Splicing factor [Apophysomyces ossiformis]|uniref:Splicing factor n=1 Tax=Apophysomyces ossiformis TaxID=679940 RepID=A0A8H7EU33_9FUNG|nr:Splicing factor [Apophysomyces ossiformis]